MTTKALRVAVLGLLVLVPAPAFAESYSMLVNHGQGWRNSGEFANLVECTQEALTFSSTYKTAQVGCVGAAALRVFEFQQSVGLCGSASGADYSLRPGPRVTILGTEEQRFDFRKCMAQAGHPVQ